MNVIETIDIFKTYHEGDVDVHALNGANLTIEKGEFTAIVGPSGSGKTTLLNIIGGLDTPSSGKVIINNTDISTYTQNQMVDFRMNNIGFVFQSYNLIPVLTAKENVEFIMLLQKKQKSTMAERSVELLNRVGLADKLDKKPSQLSGGQQQRVAVARALASSPAFILADEPTANLDSKSTENLLDLMAEMNAEEEATFVFATHDQRVINKARRVVTLEDGKIISDVRQ